MHRFNRTFMELKYEDFEIDFSKPFIGFNRTFMELKCRSLERGHRAP